MVYGIYQNARPHPMWTYGLCGDFFMPQDRMFPFSAVYWMCYNCSSKEGETRWPARMHLAEYARSCAVRGATSLAPFLLDIDSILVYWRERGLLYGYPDRALLPHP